MKEKYFYLYEIRNKINDMVYIGVHQTYNLDDGYMGSGKRLKRAQEKYGLENFEKEILFFFDSEEKMFSKEKEIVTTEFVLREDTYNLTEGGRTPGTAVSKEVGTQNVLLKRGWFSPEAREKHTEYLCSEKGKQNTRNSLKLALKALLTEEVRKKRKETFKAIKHQQGEKNSQFGKMWITDGIESRKIMKDEPIPIGWRKGMIMPKGSKTSKGKRWITNGVESTLLSKELEIPEGWTAGRLLK